MEIKTLKKLINKKFDEICEQRIMPDTIGIFKEEVFKLIDIYEEDEPSTPTPSIPFIPTPGFTVGEPDEIPYAEICGCNPKNGGNGICGCVMGNKMIPNPKKHGYSKLSNFTTRTSTDTIIIDPNLNNIK